MTYKRAVDRAKRFLFYIVAFFTVLIYLPILVWTYCYSLHSNYVLSVSLLAAIFVLIVNKSSRQALGFLLGGLAVFIILIPFSLRQYNARAEFYQDKINHGKNLTNTEKAGVYCTLMFVTAFDYVVFHEAGVENFYLFFPITNHKRTFHSEKFLKSQVIASVVKKNRAVKIEWNRWRNSSFRELGYALAFDPCTITFNHNLGYTEVILRTDVQYRQNYASMHATRILKGIFAFRVDEGLFWYLQKEKWIYPYTAVWIAIIKNTAPAAPNP